MTTRILGKGRPARPLQRCTFCYGCGTVPAYYYVWPLPRVINGSFTTPLERTTCQMCGGFGWVPQLMPEVSA